MTRPDLDAIDTGFAEWNGDCIYGLTRYARELEAEIERLRANRAGNVERLAAKELSHVQQKLKDAQDEIARLNKELGRYQDLTVAGKDIADWACEVGMLEEEVKRLRANRMASIERMAAKELPHVQQELKDAHDTITRLVARGEACTESLNKMRTESDDARAVARRLWAILSQTTMKPYDEDWPAWVKETEP